MPKKNSGRREFDNIDLFPHYKEENRRRQVLKQNSPRASQGRKLIGNPL